MIALLPAFLTKAYVRGHLRNLGGRMVEVKPYHTKTQPKRDDDRSRELFGDIPPAANQYQPRMHPARTTTPRTPIVPFKAVFPQLFEEKEVATVQNGQYNKDIKGRNPAPETEGTKMATLNENQKKAMSYMIGPMRTNPRWENGLYEHAMRWAGFSEWSGNDAVRRYYFNAPDEPNEKMFGYIKDRAVKWNGGYEGATRKPFKELNARHIAKMQAAYDQATAEMAAYIEENRQSLPIFGEGTPGEIRKVPGYHELGPYIRMEDGKWEKKAEAPATTTPPVPATAKPLPKFDPDSNEFRLFGGWNRFAEIIEGKQYAEKPEQKVDGGKKGIAWGIHGTWVKVDLLEPMMDWRKQNLSTHGMEGMIFDSLPGIKEAVQAIKQVPWVKEEPTKEAEAPATTTSSLRLSAAADYLEKEIAAAGAEADPDDLALVKQAIKTLRETTRTDLESAVWPSIFSVLGIKNASHIASLLIEQEGKGFSKAPTADRIYLTVPFSDKDKVKAKGAKWDGDRKKWYWPTSAGDMPAVVKGYAK